MVLSGVFRRSFRRRLSKRLFAVLVAEHGLHGEIAEESLLKLSKVVSKVSRKINWGKFVKSLA
jgi:hypothetical protein